MSAQQVAGAPKHQVPAVIQVAKRQQASVDADVPAAKKPKQEPQAVVVVSCEKMRQQDQPCLDDKGPVLATKGIKPDPDLSPKKEEGVRDVEKQQQQQPNCGSPVVMPCYDGAAGAPCASSDDQETKTNVAAPAVADVIPPVEAVKAGRVSGVIYPDQYDSVDMTKLVFDKPEMRECRTGGGDMAYMSLVGEDGIPRKLVFQTPHMPAPGGISTFEDGKSSILLSMGKDWQGCPSMSSFGNFCNRLMESVAQQIFERKWAAFKNAKVHPDIGKVREMIAPVIKSGYNKKTGDAYPDSFSCTVNLKTGTAVPDATSSVGKTQSATGFWKKLDKGTVIPIASADVSRNSLVCVVLEAPWIHRKKDGSSFKFSIHMRAVQVAVIKGDDGQVISESQCAIDC